MIRRSQVEKLVILAAGTMLCLSSEQLIKEGFTWEIGPMIVLWCLTIALMFLDRPAIKWWYSKIKGRGGKPARRTSKRRAAHK